MSYEAKSIYEVVKEIDAGKYYLPALQRKFVWEEDRITLLFDSILRGYPISTFLFWFLKKEKADEYVFYKFLDRYDQRDPYNKRKDGLFTQEEIIGVLDGQQRLSSIFIGLQGKYITKEKHKRYDNPHAYPERQLYLNVLNTPYTEDNGGEFSQVVIKEDENFEFSFLKPENATSKIVKKKGEPDKAEFWFRVGDIIRWNADTSANDVYRSFIKKESNLDVTKMLEDKQDFVLKTIENLRDKFIKEKIINYFKTSKEDLEAILNIFVRVNSGAMALSKSDLLFSTIIATWENGRDEIENLQKSLNQKGDGFFFSSDFIMRSLLVLSDLPVLFKVNSFTSENVKRIKSNWVAIKNALLKTGDILSEAGLSGWLIPSQNAVIPVAYFVFKSGNLDKENKADLIKYLKHAFLKNVFGSHGDNVLSSMRNALRVKNAGTGDYKLADNSFSLNDFIKKLNLPGDKSLRITDDDLEEFLESKKSHYTFILLSLIYPHFKYGQVHLHQDHIHPYSGFKDSVFEEWELDVTIKNDWLNKRDMLPNLQLMEGQENQSKNAKPFDKWLKKEFSDIDKQTFLHNNHIDPTLSLDFKKFDEFFESRKNKLRTVLKSALDI